MRVCKIFNNMSYKISSQSSGNEIQFSKKYGLINWAQINPSIYLWHRFGSALFVLLLSSLSLSLSLSLSRFTLGCLNLSSLLLLIPPLSLLTSLSLPIWFWDRSVVSTSMAVSRLLPFCEDIASTTAATAALLVLSYVQIHLFTGRRPRSMNQRQSFTSCVPKRTS